MAPLDDLADRWRQASSAPERAAAIGELFRFALRRARNSLGSGPQAPIDGASRALLAAGLACADPDTRAHVLARALDAALVEPRSTWTMQTLARLAVEHAPARSQVLSVAREQLSRPRSGGPGDAPLPRASVDALASLASVEQVSERAPRFEEMLAGAQAVDYPAFDIPYLFARAAPGVGAVAPDLLLSRIATSHEYYRAHAYALVARDLAPEPRHRAIGLALASEADPSLADARPFVAMASVLDEEQYRRALHLANRLYSSPSFGATAMRALLPGWAALGHTEDAIARARRIKVGSERGVALARIAAHVGDPGQRDALVREGIALFGAHGAHLVAADLVPLGYGQLLAKAAGRHRAEALFALASAATGEERAGFLQALSHAGGPAHLAPLASELDPAIVFERWMTAFEQACSANGEDLFEDEHGCGLVEWMPLVPLLAGADGTRQVADAIVP
jgi:hypothetical protein